jgi:hypothetical protein
MILYSQGAEFSPAAAMQRYAFRFQPMSQLRTTLTHESGFQTALTCNSASRGSPTLTVKTYEVLKDK